MTTFTTIPDGNLDPDSPVRSVDGLALRDNPISIAEGDSSAPSVYPKWLIVKDEKSAGTNGGTFSNASWQKRDLNTEELNRISGASLSSSQITLPAGTYHIYASAPAYNVSGHKTRLYDTTGSAVLLYGTSEFCTQDTSDNQHTTRSIIDGVFTLSVQSVLELQHRCDASQTDGFGRSASFGSGTEVYSMVRITLVSE